MSNHSSTTHTQSHTRGINLKSYPAVEFTINLLTYILFVVVLSCPFLKKERKTPAHGRTIDCVQVWLHSLCVQTSFYSLVCISFRSLLLLVNCLAGNIARPSLAQWPVVDRALRCVAYGAVLDKLLMLAAKAQTCLAFARLLATFAFSY